MPQEAGGLCMTLDVSKPRPDPDQLLRQVQAEEDYQRRGRLKIFLGYTSGVGKSFRMLDEGRRRHERGEDVVVGAIQPVTLGSSFPQRSRRTYR